MHMTKTEAIKIHGNTVAAYDATETYMPLVACFWDDEKILIYDVQTDKYSYLKLYYNSNYDNYYFSYQDRRHNLSDFIRMGTPWTPEKMSLEAWKKENKY